MDDDQVGRLYGPPPAPLQLAPPDSDGPSSALLVPPDAVVSIEHPCIVKNIDNGIKSLGGRVVLDKFLNTRDRDKTIGASLRPNDPMAKPVMSGFTKTQNLLLRVSLPKRTGRKRKRGSNGPWIDAPEATEAPHADAQVLLQSLRDNPASYSIQPVGLAQENHRFRQLPDFQYATSTLPLANMLRETFLPLQYPKLKNFKMSDERGNHAEPDIGPSAQFSMIEVPYNYSYRQNPAVKILHDENGRQIMYNPTASRKFIMHSVNIDAEDILYESPVPLQPEDTLEPHIRDTVANMRKLLEERPVMTRRYLANHLEAPTDDSIRSSFAYVGYSFKSGPWRDTLIKFGVDPRKDPKYRHYQTLMFKIVIPSKKESSEDPNKWMDARNVWRREAKPRNLKLTTHIFDGKSLTPDGKVWQTCDITDPQLREILDTDKLRTECNIKSDGWYLNGTWAKVKVLMRDKISVVREGGIPKDEDYRRIVDFPDLITPENLQNTTVGRDSTVSEKEYKMLADIRNLAKQNFRIWGKDKGTQDADVEMADSFAPSQQSESIVDSPSQFGNPEDRRRETDRESQPPPDDAEPDDSDMEDDLEDRDVTIIDGSEDEDSDGDEENGLDDLMGPLDYDEGSDGQVDDD
ncbi:rna polymerase iii transcription factor subunit [Diplodia corticola]|uniref:Rna polymerase iii transcription factor subunit n=1 Tax=Diplodia corticola TaxID=236234 RepID=A0A1J9QVK8_9PEZI|nr:rna polymerase iii transcription factor subunit [Diplodia corticola]OJD33022.1 rna polymerase iii transcription factor subunit [Diplodia corticola]